MNSATWATTYRQAGLSVLPANMVHKCPDVGAWKAYQSRLPADAELATWFREERSLCLVTGAVSGNLEFLDFDGQGELFERWKAVIAEIAPALLPRLLIERSPSGGWHVAYRCVEPVCGSMKLAQRAVECDDSQPVVIAGKTYVPRLVDARHLVIVTLIETKGEGGLCLCHPSPGYVLEQGDFADLPVLTADERNVLLDAAWSLNEYLPEPEPISSVSAFALGDRPGDDFNNRGDVRSILQRHGWSCVRTGANEYWRRPGKRHGWSATLKQNVFYNFSSNAAPFAPERAYAPFAVYALLEHGGDFSLAATALGREGYGQQAPGIGRLRLDLPGREEEPISTVRSMRQLVQEFPTLRPSIIDGLLRQGETMNVIAAAKTGKSWLASDLAIAVATGRPWLDRYVTRRGKVLIVDNELHPETSANRIPKVAAARNIESADYQDRVFVENLRGKLRDIHGMARYFELRQSDGYDLIILDAFYRFLPRDTDENDNGAMANIYNLIDWCADRVGCSFVLIHHASKGNQSAKSVTDVGAGAGSQSRATDTHLVFRPHAEQDVVALDAAVRSFPPIEPFCLRWEFPVWCPDEGLDPADLRRERPRRNKPNSAASPHDGPRWNAQEFAEAFVGNNPKSRLEITVAANDAGLSDYHANKLLRKAEVRSYVHRWKLPHNQIGFANRPQPQDAVHAKREQVEQMMRREPKLSNRAIAERCGVSHTYVNGLRRELNETESAVEIASA